MLSLPDIDESVVILPYNLSIEAEQIMIAWCKTQEQWKNYNDQELRYTLQHLPPADLQSYIMNALQDPVIGGCDNILANSLRTIDDAPILGHYDTIFQS